MVINTTPCFGCHSWTDEDGAQQCCTHEPLSEEVWKKKKWFEAGSPDYKDLSSLVQDKRLLKNFQNMLFFLVHIIFCHIRLGPLEVFNSAMLKYMSKRQHFSYMSMRERQLLAVLEHNENIVKRTPATYNKGRKNILCHFFIFKKHYCFLMFSRKLFKISKYFQITILKDGHENTAVKRSSKPTYRMCP